MSNFDVNLALYDLCKTLVTQKNNVKEISRISEQISRLVAKGADIHAQDKAGFSAFRIALISKNAWLLGLLLDKKKNENREQYFNKIDRTSAILSDFLNHGIAVKNDSGLPQTIKINLNNECGYYLLTLAAKVNDEKLVDELIKHGAANTDIKYNPIDASQGKYPEIRARPTPLFYAVQNPQILKKLLDISSEEDVNAVILSDPIAARTPLIEAIINNEKDSVKLLLSYKHIDINKKTTILVPYISDNALRAAVDEAVNKNAAKDALAILELLLEQPNIEIGAKALEHAKAKPEIFKLLMNRKKELRKMKNAQVYDIDSENKQPNTYFSLFKGRNTKQVTPTNDVTKETPSRKTPNKKK